MVKKLLTARQQEDGTFVPADRELITAVLNEGIVSKEPGLGTVASCTDVIGHADALGLGMSEVIELIAAVIQALENES